LSQHVNDTGRFELDLHLDEGNLDPKFFDKLDVLSYWRDRRDRYPNLSKWLVMCLTFQSLSLLVCLSLVLVLVC